MLGPGEPGEPVGRVGFGDPAAVGGDRDVGGHRHSKSETMHVTQRVEPLTGQQKRC